ncbi:MAG: amino acid ABC transporter substrate-binding protein [Rhodospirillales bacterium]|nr:amino acid ABC transporter substrate-binding protein [Alphaproteobacteria bacterium]MCB9986665.1 amino acid ABC transporter substrate-binding protein [Rhodospirillales bacterium]USO06808.1 MAG: amino acid ABC transporter substrate-binding protein [Rhodospirillales bacterium]
MKKFVLLFVLFLFSVPALSADQKESAYDRVMRTGVLRCAYGLWEPAVMRDPNTGEMSGIMYDLMQEIGKALNLKIEYNLEVDWSQIAEALQAGKADAHCAGIWATPARGRRLAFTDPISFLPATAFVREGDTRFDHKPEAINDPTVTIAIIDDDVSQEIASRDYPLAKTVSRPQIGAVEDLLVMVMTGKADVTFDGPDRFEAFNRSNPGKIRMVPTARPIRIFPNTIAVDIHEHEMVHMLNTAIHQMQDNGTFDRLKKKYGAKGYPVDFLLPVERPYKWGP